MTAATAIGPSWARGRAGGFGLIGLLLGLLIIGILCALALPRYVGSLSGALSPSGSAPGGGPAMSEVRSAEAKAIAGTLWSALQARALQSCGTPIGASAVYAATGAATSLRWSVSPGSATLSVDCATGVFTVSEPVLFTVAGTGGDVSSLRVELRYDASAAPPSRLRCSADAGQTFADC